MIYSPIKNGYYCHKHSLFFKEDVCPKCDTHPLIADGNTELEKDNPTNHVSGGRVGLVQDDSIFYNPHNARFYFKFNKFSFSPSMDFKSKNYGSELSLLFEDCRFVVKKSSIEVTNQVDSLRLFPIHGSEVDIKVLKDNAINILRMECISALKLFINKFGGVADFIPYKEWIPDNKVSHHPIIDSIPNGSTWRNDVCKKVYPNEQNVEYSSPIHAEYALTNMGLSKFSPEISSRLDSVDSSLSKVASALSSLAEENKFMALNMTSHIPLVQEASKKLEKDSEILNSILSHVAVGGLSHSFPPTNLEVEGGAVPNTAVSSSRPSTISKYDSKGITALKLSGWL